MATKKTTKKTAEPTELENVIATYKESSPKAEAKAKELEAKLKAQ